MPRVEPHSRAAEARQSSRRGPRSRRPPRGPACRRRRCGAGCARADPAVRRRPGPPGAVGHARIVARLRERGHSLEEIRRATEEGRLAFGYIEELFPSVDERVYTLARRPGDRARAGADRADRGGAGDEPRRRPSRSPPRTCSCCATSRRCSSAGLPLVAMLQLVRVYGQAMAQVADAEVRLFHLYVHEPLMRSGATGMEMAEEMLATRARAAAARVAGDGPGPSALPPALRRAGRGRPHGGRPRRRRRVDLGTAAGRDRVRRPRRLHAADRGGGRARGGRRGRAVRRGGGDDAPRRRSRDQDDRRRGDDRRRPTRRR